MSEGLPEGWDYGKLSKYCEIIGGGTPDRSNQIFWNGNIPWVSPTEITGLKSRYISKANEYITEEGLKGSSAKLHPTGTVLMTSRASIGYVAINTVPITTNQGFQSFRCKDLINNEFLYQKIIFIRPKFEELSSGSTFSEISNTNVKVLKVSIPPLPEQKKIAKILTSVDEVIETTETQINKLKDLKKGMMNALLTQGIGHTEFKDTPLGRIPVEWEVKKLANVINSIESGVSVNSENRQKFINESGILKTSAVSGGNFFPLEHKAINSDELDRAKCNPRKDTIIVSRMNTPLLVGESGYVDKEYDDIYLPDRLWMLNIADKEKVHVKWLSYMLSYGYMRNKISDAATGTSGSMKNISKPNFLAIKLTLPLFPEQQKIAKILTSIDNNIEEKQNKLTQSNNLKKSLMADLLTGRVRVKVS